MPNTLANPGIFHKVTIDSGSTQIGKRDISLFPFTFGLTPELNESQFDTAAGRPKVFSIYVEDFAPDQPTSALISLPFAAFSADQGADIEFLKKVYAKGDVIRIAPWLQQYLYRTGVVGDTLIKLPRLHAPNAMGKLEADFTVTAKFDGVAKTVIMKDTVSSSDAVLNGEIWVPRTTRLCKFAPALTAKTEIELTYFPLYRVRPNTSTVEIQKKGQEILAFNFYEVTEDT